MGSFVDISSPLLARWWGAAASVVARDSGRPVLGSVHVRCGELLRSVVTGELFGGVSLTATDSYRAVVVELPTSAGVVEFGGDEARVNVPGRAFKVGRRDGLRLEWHSSDVTEAAGAAYRVGVPVTASVGATRTTVEAVPGDFPDIWKLWPEVDVDAPAFAPVAFNPGYLGDMLAAFGKAGDDGAVVRFVYGGDGLKPVRFDQIGGGYRASCILMPVRVPDGDAFGHLRDLSGVR